MPAPPLLLDRQDELTALERQLEAARLGNGGTLVITGPAGIGKTTLLHALDERATTAGVRVLRARGDDLERDFAFGLALQLFEPVVEALDPAGRDALFAGAAALARPLLEARAVLPGDDDLFSVLHGLFWVTDHLSDQGPVVLAVDNLHLADPASTRLLHYLAPRIADLPVLVVATARIPGSPPAVLRLLERPDVTAVQLGPLSATAVEHLVAAHRGRADPDLVEACVAVSNGNPLLVQEVLACLDLPGVDAVGDVATGTVDSSETDTDTGTGTGTSTDTDTDTDDRAVAAAVLATARQRLDRLDESSLAVAAAAAVAGGGTPLLWVAEIAGIEGDDARAAAEVLAGLAVLHTTDPVTFTHGLVRHAVLDGVAPARRAALHAAAGRLLAFEGAPPERVAYHLARARPAGDARVARTLLGAARSLRLARAPAAAAEMAARALAEPPAPEDRHDVLVELAKALGQTGDPAWQAHAEEALGGRDGARAALSIGRSMFAAGRLASAAELFRRGLELVDDPDGDLGLSLLAGFASATRIDVGSQAETVARLREVDQRRRLGASPAERSVLAHLAYARALEGGPADEVVDLARRAVDPAVVTDSEIVGGILYFSGVLALVFADAWREVGAALDRAGLAARRLGSATTHAVTANYRAVQLLEAGRVEASVLEARSAVDGLEPSLALPLPGARGNLALALLEAGDLEAAQGALELPGALEHWAPSASFSFWLYARAMVRGHGGDLDGAWEDTQECGRRQDEMRALNPATIPWRAAGAGLLARLGRDAEAQALAADNLDLARSFGAPRTLSVALRTHALVHRATAADVLHEALTVLDGTPLDLERCRVLLHLGMASRRSGSLVDARDRLREALAIAEAGGAELVAARAADELQIAGARVRRTAVTGAEALTPGERRVCDLAVDGATNREIAEDLFVSVKAVEYHLSNAYRKLGITRRNELPGALGPG